MKNKEYAFYMREFLNKEGFHAGGYVLAYVERTKGHLAPEVEFTVADCSRQISLSLGMYNKAERENSLEKIDKLYEAVAGLRKQMRAAARRIDKADAALDNFTVVRARPRRRA